MDGHFFDICVIGGGINGCGIARDAAGRGYKVLLIEKGDLAQGTSSASSKLIHGGLRYLEHFAFTLVGKSLRERDILRSLAPHIVRPIDFVLPHAPGLRPLWMIRAGLWIYDLLAGNSSLKKSSFIDLNSIYYKNILKNKFKKAIAYSDCFTEDARLVVLNAMDAQMRGAIVRTRTACTHITRQSGEWQVVTDKGETVRAQMIVNAAGPWAARMIDGIDGAQERPLRLVKGSHIVVPRLYHGDHAYILQNEDKRAVFTIPFEAGYTLVGTTDVDIGGDPDQAVAISEDEVAYLCDVVNRHFNTRIAPSDRVWDYAGVRPLIDDGEGNISKASRDYRLDLQKPGGLPLLSVLGGKLTTYRILAQEAVDMIDAQFRKPPHHWTARKTLPGGDIGDDDMDRFVHEQAAEYPYLSQTLIRRYANSYGTCMNIILDGVRGPDDMGCELGGGVYGRELDYLRAYEFAQTGEDVLWRRSKLGLHLDRETQNAIHQYMEDHQ